MPAERPAGSGGSQTPEMVEQLDTAVITPAMLEEEEQLEAAGLERERKMLEKARMSWDRESTEIRYRRLQHLLEKSNIYSKFLLTKMEQQQLEEQKKKEKLERKKESLKVKKGKNSIDTSEEKPVMRKKRGREDESYNISEVMSKEEILSVVKKNKKNEDENSSSTNLCVEDLQKNKESNSIIKDRLSQTVRQNAKFFFDPVRKCNGQPVPFQQPKHFTGGVMRWYQVEGMEWLRMLWENGINGILADEMGLGKTVQCIATIALMIQRGVPGPFLVCGPLSTLPNWMAEFKRFTPDIPTMLYHGTQEERQKLVRNIHKRQGTLQIHPVVVTSFEIAMRDRNALQHCYWKYLIVDEGHRIKNMKCRLIRELKRFNADNKLLLTGTPLQNNLSELWSLLNFLLPDVFDDLKSFESWFDITSLSETAEDIIAKEREQNVLHMLHQVFHVFLFCLMHSFNTDLEVFIFLVSTRAGGLGINLTAADTVIIYDSDWNPQSDLQAQDRCHRIGQTKPVVVYRLVTANTIDQKIVERAAAKRKLEKLIIHKNHFKGGQSGLNLSKNFLDPKELMELLKSRDYEREIKGSREKVISDKDLELLLDRSDLIDQMNASGPIKEKMGLFKILENSEDSSPECLF
ncbi:lymphoid-specific helicase [Cebus imitator]|uniref:lymphoid-specific helicase n=1 Tax=Cebus imitator TaxID=2715852 RepID=UPI000809F3FC|nr:lymphoid-specific helicase [Cebus imitator]